jgi:hypothetical protein
MKHVSSSYSEEDFDTYYIDHGDMLIEGIEKFFQDVKSMTNNIEFTQRRIRNARQCTKGSAIPTGCKKRHYEAWSIPSIAGSDSVPIILGTASRQKADFPPTAHLFKGPYWPCRCRPSC